MAAIVRAELDALGYPHETDGAGNVTVRLAGREGSARSMVLAAHMDEIAVVVTAVNDDGTLAIDRSGGLNLSKIGELANGLAYDKGRPENGILLSGTVESTLKLGLAHGASVKLSGTDSPLVVISKTPMPAEVGDRVLVLGSIVDKPGENMIGAETSMRRAVWSRMSVKLGNER